MLKLYNTEIKSRLLLGTALYPSLQILHKSIQAAKTEIITLSLRRLAPEQNGGSTFWNTLRGLTSTSPLHILPNTAGCYTAKEAVTLAQMAREIFHTNWIKLEIFADDYTLQPHIFELVKAAEILIAQGFEVFPYMTDDLTVAKELVSLGCKVLMPWASPIGSGKGIINVKSLQLLRDKFPDTTLIVDAGIGAPSHAAQAMELGFDAVLLNTAIAKAKSPILMAQAFSSAIQAGREAYLAGIIPQKDFASASSPQMGLFFKR